MTGGRLRVCTYNVRACVGTDGVPRPDSVASVLRDIDADILGLQELARVGGVDQLALLGERLGLNVVGGVTRPDGFGNGVLTRLPVVDVRRTDLSVPPLEPRGAMDVELDAGGRNVGFINTHLGLRYGERWRQVRRLLAVLGESDQPRLLAGDFNVWLPGGASRALVRRLGPGTRRPTYPALRPMFPLDRMWALGASTLEDVYVVRTRSARRASDHLPLVGTWRLD